MGSLVDLFSRLSVRPVQSGELLKCFDKLQIQGEPSRRTATTFALEASTNTRVIVECMYKAYSDNLNAEEIALIGIATQELAGVLYHSNPEQTRILKCNGYFHAAQTRRYGLIYELPPSKSWAVDPAGQARVLSLRELLNRVPHFPLNTIKKTSFNQSHPETRIRSRQRGIFRWCSSVLIKRVDISSRIFQMYTHGLFRHTICYVNGAKLTSTLRVTISAVLQNKTECNRVMGQNSVMEKTKADDIMLQ